MKQQILHQLTFTAMMTPLGTCLILSTTPYAPLPSSSICSRSSANTTKFWASGRKEDVTAHTHYAQHVENTHTHTKKRGCGSDSFTWSPILTQAFESRSRGGLPGVRERKKRETIINLNDPSVDPASVKPCNL